jgi:predicted GNAT family N-acyltransferase
VEIKLITTASPIYEKMLDLRDEVLRKPIGLTLDRARLAGESSDFLIVMEIEGQVKGCVILTPASGNTLKLRQMAVAAELQGKGYGSRILSWAENLGRQHQFQSIEMHARKYAVPFYEKAGYRAFGEEFTEVGIPHCKMKKNLF